MVAYEAAGDPDRFPDAGEPWQPLKLYYHHGFNRPRMVALHEALLAEGLESPFAERLEEWKEDPAHDARITTRVECGEYFPIRDQALIAHATQIDPDGFFFQAPMELQQRVWPTEEYELARTSVETELPEDDLFAGIRDRPDLDT
jgi:mycothiol S-conjugate amidase